MPTSQAERTLPLLPDATIDPPSRDPRALIGAYLLPYALYGYHDHVLN